VTLIKEKHAETTYANQQAYRSTHTSLVHNITQNNSDNLPCYPPDHHHSKHVHTRMSAGG